MNDKIVKLAFLKKFTKEKIQKNIENNPDMAYELIKVKLIKGKGLLFSQPDIIEYTTPEFLNKHKDLVELAVNNGYTIKNNIYDRSIDYTITQIAATNYNLTKKLIEQGQTYIINYTTPEFLNEHKDLIELALDNGYVIRYGFPESDTIDKLIATNYNLTKKLIEQGQTYIINYTTPEFLNEHKDLIELALDNGYENKQGFPVSDTINKLIATNYNLTKKLIEQGQPYIINYTTPEFLNEHKDLIELAIEKGQTYIIDCVTEKFINEHKDLIELAIDNGYSINYRSSQTIKKLITENYELTKTLIEKGQPDIIDYVTDKFIHEHKDLIELALDNGYVIKYGFPKSDTINKLITENYELTKKAIEKGQPDIIDYVTDKFIHEHIAENYELTKKLIEIGETYIIDYVTEKFINEHKDLIELALDNGYVIKHGSLKINELIARNYELTKTLIEKGQPDIIDYVTDEFIHEHKDLIELAIDNGYLIKHGSLKINELIARNYELTKTLIEKGQTYIINYTTPEFLNEHKDLIELAIDNGYSINYGSSQTITKLIARNYELTKTLIEKGQPDIIDYVTDEFIHEHKDLIELAIDNGYEIKKIIFFGQTKRKIIAENYELTKKLIEKGQPDIINSVTEKFINEHKDLIELAIDNGYFINNVNPIINELIARNYESTKKLIEQGQTYIINYTTPEFLNEHKDLIELALDNGYVIRYGFPESDTINKLIVENYELTKKAIEKGQPDIIDYVSKEALEKNLDLIVNAYNNGYNKLEMLLTIENIEILPNDLRKIRENTVTLLKEYGKINTLEKNPIISYDFMKYVYPILGLELCKDMLKYKSGASEQIINQLKKGNISLITNYYNKICSQIYRGSDRTIHYAFRYFDKYENLIREILENEYILTEEDLTNLKKIISNANRYEIKTVQELKQYKETVGKKVNDIINYNDINKIKEMLSRNFGFLGFLGFDNTKKYTMKNVFTNFQMDNYHKLNFIIESIKKSKMIKPEQLEKYMLTDQEQKIILLMKEIIETENIQVLQNLIKANIVNNEIIDYADDVNRIIDKLRNIYNLQFKTKLTDLNKIKSQRKLQKSIINVYENEKDNVGHKEEVTYEIIDMNSEKFNFLCHRIYHYDPEMIEFYEMLIRNPQLWTKLDGASTLSTSSISDKGFFMLHPEDNSGIIYLFNNVEEDFMLFMYGRDLCVEHGGHKLEPTSNENYFTDIDGLNQASVYRYSEYNEVAGFRKNMMPCAIACVGEEPNEEQIRAAAYFKVPIIRFNQKAYSDKRIEEYKQAKENIKINPSLETIESIFLSGDIKEYDDQLDVKYDYCFNIIKEKYMNKEITQEEFIQKTAYIQSLLDRICDDENKNKKLIRKTELFIETFCAMQNITEEELIKIETANMGESGVMFKLEEQGKEYLLKPAVDKNQMQKQNFRAEIQKSASILQKIISNDTAVNVDVIGNDIKISKQEKIELSNNNNVLNDWVNGKIELEKNYSDQLLQEYVVDFLLCNFDCFDGNFIIDKNNNIRGIDKEQSFRFIDNPESLKPDFSYVPNGTSRIPIYKTLFEEYKKGKIKLDFNTFDETIERVKVISDEQYKNIFKKYAEEINPINPELVLNKILERKHKCTEIMIEYIESLKELQKGEHKL